MVLPGHLPDEALDGAWKDQKKGPIMEPAMMAAVVPAVIGAVGVVLGAWVRARAQRPSERDRSRSGDAGHVPPDGPICRAPAGPSPEAVSALGLTASPGPHRAEPTLSGHAE